MKTALACILVGGVLAAPTLAQTDRQAEKILGAAGVHGGLVVHLGCGDGRLTAALRASDRYVVQGLDSDAANVDRARAHLRNLGLCGPVSILPWDEPSRLPYADNLVNLLVADDLGSLPPDEVTRVLAPGGVVCVCDSSGAWRTTRKPWPDGMDQWTHWAHAADGNPVSGDRLVGPPRQMQWTDGPAWSKKHWGPRLSALVTAGGRLFCVQDETPTSLFNIDSRWVLIARDAFNGVVLWRRELPRWTNNGWGAVKQKNASDAPAGLELGVWGDLTGGSGARDAMRVMVAGGDRLYVPLAVDEPLSALDAATGKVLRTYDGLAPVDEVVLAEDVLLIGGRGTLRAVAPQSGRLLWEAPGREACIRNGRVFCLSPRGRSVVCLDLKSGSQRWETGFDRAIDATGDPPTAGQRAFTGPLQAGANVLLVGSQRQKNNLTVALAVEDGKPLWRGSVGDRPFATGGGPFFIDDRVWLLDSAKGQLAALDPQTGKAAEKVATPSIRFVGHHPRCYNARATCRFILAKERGADFVDLSSGEVTWSNWLRGPCHRGVIPANGLLYAGQHSCRCYTEAALHGFHALAPGPVAEAEQTNPERHLHRGPAYGSLSDMKSASDAANDWPTYRHDPQRSGAAPVAVDGKLTSLWSAALPAGPSAPVVADGRAYVAAVDAHTVYAFDAAGGEPLWCYTAGARVDTPPTIYRGMALFGSRDGWVYCISAADGRLVWRFRAAPAGRMIGAGGQLESAWPVPGSILVRDGVAYCVAGRSSFLDGGMRVYALDPASGRLLATKHLDGPWPAPGTGSTPETPNRGFIIDGALPDVLVADSQSVYLRQLRFDPALATMEDMQPNFYKATPTSPERTGGDHKYYDNLVEAERHALFNNPAWFHRSFFQNFPGRRLYATTGLLDDSWHRRMYWAYGQVVGQYIVFRDEMGYAVQVFATSPREGGSNSGAGYVVYAGRTAEREEETKLFALRPTESKWRIRVPLRPVAMALTGNHLLLAGPPDAADPTEGLAAVEGRRGAALWSIDTATGRTVTQQPLPGVPVWEGLASAGGRLFLSCRDGRLVCLGKSKP